MINQSEANAFELPRCASIPSLETFVNDRLKSLYNEMEINMFLKHIEDNLQENCSQEETNKLLKLAREHKLLKVIEACVPQGILHSSLAGTLCDVRIGGYGPDDEIYQKNKFIRENITRGMTFLKLSGQGRTPSTDLVIYANKKFTGYVGDEDEEKQPENNEVVYEYFLEPYEKDGHQKVVCTSKLNGEAGHFSGRFIDDEFYIIAGSKNVHMLFQTFEHIDMYKEQRYDVARQVARAVLTQLNKLESRHMDMLKTLLHETRFTIVCEIQQKETQHIVNFDHLKEAELGVLMMTSTAGVCNKRSLTAVRPDMGINFFQKLGFIVPELSVTTASQTISTEVERIRGDMDYEGCVFYYINERQETFGLLKVKTVWYIMLRALREKVDRGLHATKRNNMQPVDVITAKTKKRFGEIKNWLELTNNYVEQWEKLASHFIVWMDGRIRSNKCCGGDIRPQFPRLWKEFLSHSNLSDRIQLKS